MNDYLEYSGQFKVEKTQVSLYFFKDTGFFEFLTEKHELV